MDASALGASLLFVIVSALAMFAAQVGLIFALGAFSLVLFRHRGLHRFFAARVAPASGVRAFVLDALFAGPVTYCGCMTQPALSALASTPARAVRFLSWCSAARITLAMGLLAAGAGAADVVVVVAAVLAWGAAMGPRLATALSAGAVFVARAPRGAVRDAVVDSRRETGEMLAAYGRWLALLCAIAGGLLALPFGLGVGIDQWPSALAAPLGVLLALVIPVDLLGALPVLIALGLGGAPVALLVPLAVGLEVTAARTLRLAHGYLRPEGAAGYTLGARLLTIAIGLLWAL